MGRHTLLGAMVGMILVPLAAGVAQASLPLEVTVPDLLADPQAFAVPEVPEVSVRGELVGDYGRRGDGTIWTQLNGDAYADAPLLSGGELAGANVGIGVRIPASVWPGFDEVGGYRVRGPLVRLTGAWRFHDPDRGGESYLDVTAVEVLEEPLALEEQPCWIPLGVGLVLLGAALVGWSRRRRRQER